MPRAGRGGAPGIPPTARRGVHSGQQAQGGEALTRRQGALAHLARGIQHCRSCPLHGQRHHAVPGEGRFDARVVVVGEAPGAEEDRTGRPFVGAAGRFLDGLLQEEGSSRSDVFLTSCVKCRPPGNRTPHAQELDICARHWLLPQLDLVAPAVVVMAGLNVDVFIKLAETCNPTFAGQEKITLRLTPVAPMSPRFSVALGFGVRGLKTQWFESIKLALTEVIHG